MSRLQSEDSPSQPRDVCIRDAAVKYINTNRYVLFLSSLNIFKLIMKYSTALIATVLAAATVSARQIVETTIHARGVEHHLYKREIPQENSHHRIYDAFWQCFHLDTGRFGGTDPIISLLGAKADSAAPDGNGKCLQQDMCDQAIQNAVTHLQGDAQKNCIILAMQFRALERNTLGSGLASAQCDHGPKSGYLTALTQHQDPAAPGATANNKEVELVLARKLAIIGSDPMKALDTATFPAGKAGDSNFHENSCDDNDCIFNQGLLRPIATQDQIRAAAARALVGDNTGGEN